ncbi:hypothetical protein, partial [Klebsiella quasipneumoniae]|uniref:hypothetical protein n=1 Tax=Klebsiella quasipneumoniae TaxID=1463165 RepID=UPI0037476061
HGACVEQDDKGWDARKRAYCLKIQPATGSFARNLIYSTKPYLFLIYDAKGGNRPLIPPAVLVHHLKLSVNIRHQELSCHYIARS